MVLKVSMVSLHIRSLAVAVRACTVRFVGPSGVGRFVDVTAETLAGGKKVWSGLRGSNPCPRLGKPLYYHCTKPASDDRGALLKGSRAFESRRDPVSYYERISASTSSRLFAINAGVVASRLSRSSGSVFDGLTLKCQSGYSTERPSRVY